MNTSLHSAIGGHYIHHKDRATSYVITEAMHCIWLCHCICVQLSVGDRDALLTEPLYNHMLILQKQNYEC
jgi:hypothetical protein